MPKTHVYVLPMISSGDISKCVWENIDNQVKCLYKPDLGHNVRTMYVKDQDQ